MCVGLWRRRGLAFIGMGPCLFLAVEGKDRGFALHHSSAVLHTLSLKLAVGEMHVQGLDQAHPHQWMKSQRTLQALRKRTIQAPHVLASQALHSRKHDAPLQLGELKIWQLGFPGRCWEILCLPSSHSRTEMPQCLAASLWQPSFSQAPLLLCPSMSDTQCSPELPIYVAETLQRSKEVGRMCPSYWFPQTCSVRCKSRCHKV